MYEIHTYTKLIIVVRFLCILGNLSCVCEAHKYDASSLSGFMWCSHLAQDSLHQEHEPNSPHVTDKGRQGKQKLR